MKCFKMFCTTNWLLWWSLCKMSQGLQGRPDGELTCRLKGFYCQIVVSVYCVSMFYLFTTREKWILINQQNGLSVSWKWSTWAIWRVILDLIENYACLKPAHMLFNLSPSFPVPFVSQQWACLLIIARKYCWHYWKRQKQCIQARQGDGNVRKARLWLGSWLHDLHGEDRRSYFFTY